MGTVAQRHTAVSRRIFFLFFHTVQPLVGALGASPAHRGSNSLHCVLQPLPCADERAIPSRPCTQRTKPRKRQRDCSSPLQRVDARLPGRFSSATAIVAATALGALARTTLEGAGEPAPMTPWYMTEAAATTQLIVVRHCDKVANATAPGFCTARGYEHGAFLAQLFGSTLPPPTHIFARRPAEAEPDYADRDLWMLWPTAQRFGLRVNATLAKEEVPALAAALASRQHPPGSVILLSWDHCQVPWLLQELGCASHLCRRCWSDVDFDSVLVLSLREGAAPTVKSLREGFEGRGRYRVGSCRNEVGGDRCEESLFVA